MFFVVFRLTLALIFQIFDASFSSTSTHFFTIQIHVDLGCGDGRVNFFALDHGKVSKSTGIDIDEGILQVAKDRLAKRYPQPPIEFIQADLLNRNDPVWTTTIAEATIITMYFVEDALQKIKPIIEEILVGKPSCKIITCGYEMKGWNHTIMETSLGMTVFVYEWDKKDDNDEDDGEFYDEEDEQSFFEGDDILPNKPRSINNVADDPNLAEAIASGKIKHNSIPFFLQGYDPGEKIDGHWDTFDADDEEWERQQKEKQKKDSDDNEEQLDDKSKENKD